MFSLHLAALLLALAGGPRPAPTPDEQRLYEQGERALEAGDAHAAEVAWQAGYAIARDPAFLVHIGEAQEKAGQAARAAESYRRYLREAPDASDRGEIESRIARLTPPASAAAPAAEPVGELGATPPVPPAPPPAPAAGGTTPALAGDNESPAGVQEVSAWTPYNITAYSAAGAALVLLATAGFFAAEAGSDADDVNRLLVYRDPAGKAIPYSSVAAEYEDKVAAGHRHDRYAKVALIGAAGAATVSALFFVLDARHTHEPTVAVAPGPGGYVATAGWAWRF
jgi:hypothetical protein